ncbi:hypothetical protein [Actinomadura macrotermitis]|uniref:hypothetical protein n=1 Tax=Actinomadura macrotermitis TaxID=2585200 RepID=UPI001297C288|nr:hypothetical protein [Actinomadura macrotermitis]
MDHLHRRAWLIQYVAMRFGRSKGDSGGLTQEELRVGYSGRFEGIYSRHWEFPRFELVVRSRRRRREVLLQLESEAVPWPEVIEQAAKANPIGFSQYRVVVDADIVEYGRFGHRGSLRWRLSVRRWVSVEPLP